MDFKMGSIADQYNKNVFLESIKTGKTPKRAGLGTRLYLLGGFDRIHLPCHVERNANPPFEINIDLPHLTNRLCYRINIWNSNPNEIVYDLYSNKMRQIYTKYLGEHHVTRNWCFVFVHYNPSIEINWGVLDHDLKEMYPKNHRIDKRGFVYHKS
jgi:hypothetical protein